GDRLTVHERARVDNRLAVEAGAVRRALIADEPSPIGGEDLSVPARSVPIVQDDGVFAIASQVDDTVGANLANPRPGDAAVDRQACSHHPLSVQGTVGER